MKAKSFIVCLCLVALSCGLKAQQDSLVIPVRGIDIVMVKVEGGTYQRGCTPRNEKDTVCRKCIQGENSVTISPFYIAKLEVTEKLYSTIVHKKSHFVEGYYYPDATDSWPAMDITWYEAQDFIDSLNRLTGMRFRLPTEAEWEYAARGGIHQDKFKYAGSDNLSEVSYIFTATISNKKSEVWCNPENVGERKPNSLGLYNMTGNAAEWCSDWYSDTYYQTQTAFNNPTGPKEGTKKSYRGGGPELVVGNMMDIRFRRGVDPTRVHNRIGIRLAMDAEPVKH
ncbi:MAG: formylglycine-generating enzyme family protein [Bacteroidales bacterium]|nr:formylglycine-generating enzyme family protein [Bacteroidales bacterium]